MKVITDHTYQELWTFPELIQLVESMLLVCDGQVVTPALAKERANNIVTALMAKDLIAS